jgi:hypothetical protein
MDIIQKRTQRVIKSFNALVPLAFQGVLDLSKKSNATEREISLAHYYWMEGKFPPYLSRFTQEARYLGRIAGNYYNPKMPENITPLEKTNALKLLTEMCKWIYTVWASKAYAKLWVSAGSVEMSAIRVQLSQLSTSVEFSYEYISILRVLFP